MSEDHAPLECLRALRDALTLAVPAPDDGPAQERRCEVISALAVLIHDFRRECHDVEAEALAAILNDDGDAAP